MTLTKEQHAASRAIFNAAVKRNGATADMTDLRMAFPGSEAIPERFCALITDRLPDPESSHIALLDSAITRSKQEVRQAWEDWRENRIYSPTILKRFTESFVDNVVRCFDLDIQVFLDGTYVRWHYDEHGYLIGYMENGIKAQIGASGIKADLQSHKRWLMDQILTANERVLMRLDGFETPKIE